MEGSAFDVQLQNLKLEYRIVAALEKMSETFRVMLWEESKKTGLSPIQIQALVFILFQPMHRATVTVLAREFNMTRATMSESIKTLERKALLIRNRADGDNRSSTITLTNNGEKVARSCSVFANPLLEQISLLAPDLKDNLLDALLKIIRLLDKNGIISAQRMCTTCQFFRTGNGEHYCSLINQQLKQNDLRLDCPEHERASVLIS